MKTKILVFLALCLCLSAVPAFAQKQKPDPEIQKMLKEVSAKNIEATIRKLVSFGTRNTLSDQTSKERGIGAARDWILSEFRKISVECGMCPDPVSFKHLPLPTRGHG